MNNQLYTVEWNNRKWWFTNEAQAIGFINFWWPDSNSIRIEGNKVIVKML